MKIKSTKKVIKIEKYFEEENISLVADSKCFFQILNVYDSIDNIQLLLITADIIWFSEELSLSIKNIVSKRIGIPFENITLCASHTHSTPNPDKSFKYKKAKSDIFDFILNELGKCLSKLEKKKFINVSATYVRKKAPNISINRRKKALRLNPSIGYYMQSLPNDIGIIDNFIDILNFSPINKKKVVASIVKYTCHPVTQLNKTAGADYIGYLRNILKVSYSSNIFFCQGYCGDIRPKLLNKKFNIKNLIISALVGKRFRESQSIDSLNFAKKLAKSINSNDNTLLVKRVNRFKGAAIKKIKLQLINNKFSKEELLVQTWKFDEIFMIFVNAEMLSGYIIDYYEGKPVINIGYSNGMIGYVPTAKDIKDGGYEVNKSRKIFNIENTFNLNIENKIKKSLHLLLK
tara:strand:- start:10 stop:1221 length:1212 start_codon:yes stop_codon:yes gene_type:complete